MSNDYIKFSNKNSQEKSGPRRLVFKSSDMSEEGAGANIENQFTKGIFSIEVPNIRAYKEIPSFLSVMETTFFKKDNRIKHLYIDLTTDEELIIKTLIKFLEIKGKKHNKFDITLSQNCLSKIKHNPYYLQNKHHFLIEQDEQSHPELYAPDILEVMSNLSRSSEITENELKIYIYLFGKFLKSLQTNIQSQPIISYHDLISIFEKSRNQDKKNIIKSVDRLKKRGLVKLTPLDKKADLRLIELQFRNRELDFGALR